MCNYFAATLLLLFVAPINYAPGDRSQPLRYDSQNKHYRLKVVPGAGGVSERNAASPAIGTLFRLDERNESYSPIWTVRLRNPVVPDLVVVSDTGDYVVTIDDWRWFGNGDNVLVIYGSQGKVIRHFALSDLLTPDQIKELAVMHLFYVDEPLEVSVRRWFRDGTIDNKTNTLTAVVAIDAKTNGERFEVSIDLANGKIERRGWRKLWIEATPLP